MVWRYAYCFLRILKLFFLHFNLDIFSSLYARDMYREYMPCIGNPAYSFRPILLKLCRYFAAFLWFRMRNLSLAGYNCSGGASCMACSFIKQSCTYMPIKCFIMPRHQKVAGYYVIPSEILSVRPSVCLSVHPSVRPSVSAHHHSCIGNSSYSFRPILLKLYRCFKDGLKICILFFQNPEIIFYHFFPIFNLDIFRALILQYVYGVCTLYRQLLLQFLANPFETLQVF